MTGFLVPQSPENGCRDCRQREVTVIYRPYRRISNNDGLFRTSSSITLLRNSFAVGPPSGGQGAIETCFTAGVTLPTRTSSVTSRPVGQLVSVTNAEVTNQLHTNFASNPSRFAGVSSRCPGAPMLLTAVNIGFFTEDGAFRAVFISTGSSPFYDMFWRQNFFTVTETRPETFRCEKQEGAETMSFNLGGECFPFIQVINTSVQIRQTTSPWCLTVFSVRTLSLIGILGSQVQVPIPGADVPLGEICSDPECPPPEWQLVCGLVDCRECPPETACECESDDGSLCCYGADGSLIDTISPEDRC